MSWRGKYRYPSAIGITTLFFAYAIAYEQEDELITMSQGKMKEKVKWK